MIEIDGSHGEGGGQVLRTSLALSIVTGKPFRLFNIRAGRKSPGLKKQHLACVRAAKQISNANVRGDAMDSMELSFTPDGIYPGQYRFSVGSAGSAALVYQTVLLPLLHADAPSFVMIEGGTHAAWAPPFDFLQHTFTPLLERMGATTSLSAERLGFYPAGGGLLHARIQPWAQREHVELVGLTNSSLSATAYISKLPAEVAQRELRKVKQAFVLDDDALNTVDVRTPGPGNALCIYSHSEQVTEVVTAFGKRGVKAEVVAKAAIKEMLEYLEAGVPVGQHLADQLLLPMALGAGGHFRTLEPSGHTRTNIETIKRFLDVQIDVEPIDGAWEIRVGV
ncbi:MAG: RNA 3'-terminal phosphate cyclase [Planctomycetes bacterium]|nr:RNA 3'-terminal phosphate cyclase [Planctomycetota bacterium]